MAPRIIRPPPHWRPVDPLPCTSVWDLCFSNPNIEPSRVLLVDAQTGEEMTHAELRSRAQRLAGGLVRKVGLRTGDVVTIFSPNTIHYHVMVLAAQCAGLIVSAANAAYAPSELAHQIRDSSSSLVLAHPSVLDTASRAAQEAGWDSDRIGARLVFAVRRAEAGAEGRVCLDDLWTEKELPPVTIKDPRKTVAYIGYSSGTTGAAKGVMTSHFNMTSVLSHLYPFPHNHVQIAVLPLNHIYGLTKLVHFPVLTGQKTVILPRFDLEAFCAAVDRYQVSSALIVPPIAVRLAKDPIAQRYDLGSLRFIVSGAAPMGPELEKELQQRLPNADIAQAYGLTETSPTTHFCPTDEPHPGTVGYLLPNQLGRIVDPVSGDDCQPGQEGELWLKGPNVMLGYLNRPDATKDAITPDGWFKTGDVAKEDGGIFTITDRIKELIKYKGFQVPPAELEALLLTHPNVADVAVIGVYDSANATELPRAYIVSTGAKDDKTAKEIISWTSERVAPHKRLRGGVRFVDEIPKSPSGKILRRVLKDQLKAEQSPKAKL